MPLETTIRRPLSVARTALRPPVRRVVPHAPRHTSLELRVFTGLLFADSLEAYNLLGVPITWLAHVATVVYVGLLLVRSRWNPPPGFALFGWLMTYSLAITLGYALSGDFARLMPQRSTTSYHVYIALRIVMQVAFAAQLYWVFRLVQRYGWRAIAARCAWVGTIAATLAAYIYLAQLTGLPELPRNRMGTSGYEQATTFSYAFHRAMGTFLEPGDLGGWLVLPFFCSLVSPSRYRIGQAVSIAAIILLSGSLAAIGSAAAGIVAAICILRPTQARSLVQLAVAGAVIGIAGLVFTAFVSENSGGTGNLLQVMQERINPMINHGVSGTNRDYVYEYLSGVEVSYLGIGLGHPQLLMAECLGLPVIGSFLNLYATTLHASGWLGLALLVLFLLVPIRHAVRGSGAPTVVLVFLLAAYASWLLRFFFCVDEPPLNAAIAYSLLAGAALARPVARRATSPGAKLA